MTATDPPLIDCEGSRCPPLRRIVRSGPDGADGMCPMCGGIEAVDGTGLLVDHQRGDIFAVLKRGDLAEPTPTDDERSIMPLLLNDYDPSDDASANAWALGLNTDDELATAIESDYLGDTTQATRALIERLRTRATEAEGEVEALRAGGKRLGTAKFMRRRTFHTDPGGEFVELRVYDGQENLHIDGEYSLYRRTEGPAQGRVLVDEVTKSMSTADFSATVTDQSWVHKPDGGFALPVPPGTHVQVVVVGPTDPA